MFKYSVSFEFSCNCGLLSDREKHVILTFVKSTCKTPIQYPSAAKALLPDEKNYS